MQVSNLVTRNAGGTSQYTRKADINSNYGIVGHKSYGDRAITAGGAPGPTVNNIEYCSIGTLTHGVDFGDMTESQSHGTGSSDGVRGMLHLGNLNSGEMDYINIGTRGNALNFGPSFDTPGSGSGSDGNKMIIWGGSTYEFHIIGIASAATDFGELDDSKIYRHGGDGDGTYACTVGGYPAVTNIELINFGSGGAASEFSGELAVSGYGMNHCTDGNRQLRMGAIGFTATIDSFVIASGGAVVDFGDLVETAGDFDTGTSDGSRGVCLQGNRDPSSDQQEYVNIGVYSNAIDFSEAISATYMAWSTSGG